MDWLATLKTYLGYEGATALANKLTAARAGYLDNINNANLSTLPAISAARVGYLDNINNAQLLNVPNLSTLTAARIGYLDNVNQAGLLQFTAARAGYLDNINNAQLLNIPDLSTLTAARIGYLDNLYNRTGRVLHFKDQWCHTPIASLAITNTAGDLSFSDVVLPSGFLPSGVVIQAVYLLFKWRKQVDSSGATNAISAASKTIRVKLSTRAWGTDDIVAITFASGQLSTGASSTEGGDAIVGDANLSSKITSDNVTVNVQSNQTNRTDALVVTAASLTLYDIFTGLRVYFTLGS